MKRLVIFAFFSLSVLLLAACGGDGGSSEPESVSLSFEGIDAPFSFSPDSASVPTGAEVSVAFNNTGSLDHTWVLVSEDTNAALVTDADALGGASSGVVVGGESATFTFTAPAAGTYQFMCTIPGHASGGMVGTLTVNSN